jgi:hypothetical protein
MKNIPSSILAMLALLLGAGVAIQSVRIKHQKDRAAAALDEKSLQVEQLTADVERLEEACRFSHREVDDLRHELAGATSEPAPLKFEGVSETASSNDGSSNTSEPGRAFGSMLAKMMGDPDMKQFIRNQQRQIMDPLYDPLIQRLGLTPEEGAVFKDYLADAQMNAANQAGALFGGSATNRAEAMATLSEEQKRADETLKGFLGEEGYVQFKDYQETLGERMQLNQFRLQSGAKSTITDEQIEWLLALMKEEKRAVAASTGQAFLGTGQDQAQMQSMLSGENGDQILKRQETVNQRVYARASEGLEPDQLAAFGRFQSNQLQTMRMGMSMMRMIITPASEGGNAAR